MSARRRDDAAIGPDAFARLEREALRPFYLLHGEEPFLVERALAVLRRRLVPAGRPGTWRTVWAGEEEGRLAAALADLASPPLFGGQQVLVVRRAEALREDEQARIKGFLPALGSGGSLILVARTADQRRSLVAACQRAGAVIGFAPVGDARVLHAWVVRFARDERRDIAPAAVEELLDRRGGDLGVLAGEIEKLALQKREGGRIDVADVRAVVSSTRPHAVDELTDRLGRRDLAGAANALRQLLGAGEPPIKVAAFLAANLRRALHVAELAEQGLGPEDIARRLGMPGWLVARQRGRGRARDLARALAVLARLDLELKRSRPAEAVFEAALLEIAGP